MREDMMAVLGGGGLRGMMKRGETEIECSWQRWETQSNDLFTVRPDPRCLSLWFGFPKGREPCCVCGLEYVTVHFLLEGLHSIGPRHELEGRQARVHPSDAYASNECMVPGKRHEHAHMQRGTAGRIEELPCPWGRVNMK
jgi:hypothetical protein